MPFKTLDLDLKYCYGIASLKARLDADDRGAFAIYAPNGTMKTSLSKTFADLAAGRAPRDEIYPTRRSHCRVIADGIGPLSPDQILVIPPYADSFQRSGRVSTLLVNPKLRDRYREIEAELDSKRDRFRKDMQAACGRRVGVEEEIGRAFTGREDGLFDAVCQNRPKVEGVDEAPLASVPYGALFSQQVEEFLAQGDVREILEGYVQRLNHLLDESRYFSRQTFSYYGAEQVAATLEKHGFFEAKHRIELVGDTVGDEEPRRVASKAELTDLVRLERDQISSDAELRKRYGRLGSKLAKNQAMRNFKECLDSHPELIPKLGDLEALKREVWLSYFVSNKESFLGLADAYESTSADRVKIQQQAEGERTQWEDVIRVFNQRFSVPFHLEARNHVDLVLGRVEAMELSFEFKDEEGESVPVDHDRLLRSLSQGEKRAMYLLDVLFEVEARRKEGTPTLFVFDDVADSFDYKNKYAIVRYLEEIMGWADGRMIILTHNFDFLRSVHGTVVHRSRCQIAIRERGVIELRPLGGINNIFTKDWKRFFFRDKCKRVASIPFMRNLVEYTRGKDDPSYVQLTSLMHWKPDTPSINNSSLDNIYNSLFGTSDEWSDSEEAVWATVVDAADECVGLSSGAEFHTKVVLAMACRLLADRLMVNSLGHDATDLKLSSNQTRHLFNAFREYRGEGHEMYDALHRTVLITPEQLHLNAFMYEPIIDVSDHELKSLYADLRGTIQLAG